jgi:outer membrane protein assembly factor BamB
MPHRQSLHPLIGLLCLWLGVGGETPAKDPARLVVLPGESTRSAADLARADERAAAADWPEAIREYQRVLDESANDLVATDPKDPRHCVQARWICHLRLAVLPREALRLYRDRADAEAGRRLADARRQLEQGGDPAEARALLRRIVEDAFCSRPAEHALESLGDMAFERGNFAEADQWWRMLAVPASRAGEKPAGLIYPDPSIDLARVRAKQVLARLYQGERASAAAELAAFRRLHATARGPLAGATGIFADLLDDVFRTTVSSPHLVDDPGWPTFAGGPSRNHVVAQVPRWLERAEQEAWSRPLPTESGKASAKSRRKSPLGATARRLSFFPVIAGNQVLLSDARRILAYDLTTGQHQIWFDLDRDLLAGILQLETKGESASLCHTLTVAEGRVFARMGRALDIDKSGAETDTYLVCLDLAADGTAHYRWHVKARLREGETDAFEGAPVVRDGRVYIAMSRLPFRSGDDTHTAIACFDSATGQQRWRQEICTARDLRSGRPRGLPHLLTLAGPLVVYCSHAGAVVAVDASTGRATWAVRYPSRGPNTADGDPSPRDVAPVVSAGSRLFAAPADYDVVLCLDAITGQTLWQSQRLEAVQILGVAGNRVVLTTGSWPRGIRALDEATGQALRTWQQPGDGGGELPTLGRGFLAGSLVYWPTVEGWRVLNVSDGQPELYVPQLQRLPPGNAALGDGCLAIADRERLTVFLAPGRQLEQRQRDANADPRSAAAHYRLGLALADLGQDEKARDEFSIAEKSAGRDTSLIKRGQQRRYELLLDQAARARADRQWSKAAETLTTAAHEEFPTTPRVQALAALVDVWTAAAQSDRAQAVRSSIGSDPALGNAYLMTPDGTPRRASQLFDSSNPKVTSQPGAPKTDSTLTHTPPNLALPLVRRWQTRLAANEVLLVPGPEGATAEVCLTTLGKAITCRDVENGTIRWRREAVLAADWANCSADHVFLGGPDGAACLRLSDGQALWEYTPFKIGQVWSQPGANERFDQFQCVGGRLFFIHGQNRLFALEATTGHVLWAQWAPGAVARPAPPAGRFHPHYYADQDRVVVQATGGRLLIIDARTGDTLHDRETVTTAWPRAPYPLDQRRVLLVLDGQHVLIIDVAAGAELSRFTARWPSLQAPVLVRQEDKLLALIDGFELQRWPLPQSGQWTSSLWQRMTGSDLIDRRGLAVDSNHVYLAGRESLRAFALDDGRPLWSAPLAASQQAQRVVRTQSALLVHPTVMAAGQEFSVSNFDPKDGQLVQRLNFGPTSAAAVQLCRHNLIVATGEYLYGY